MNPAAYATRRLLNPSIFLTAAIVLAGALAPPLTAWAQSTKSCVSGCKVEKTTCIGIFKARFGAEKAACTGADKKACTKAAKQRFKENKTQCKNLFRQACKTCCNAGGTVGECNVVASLLCGNGIADTDAGEQCDGGACCMAGCTFEPATTQCRAALGACDVAESCSGGGGDCPPDAVRGAGIECRAAGGPCDVAESCSGDGRDCPPDAVQSAGTVCRPEIGACDVAESCNGSGSGCPANALRGAGEVCRPAEGACDVPETCNGSSAGCPTPNLFVEAGVVCRPEAGECDIEEECTGASPSCPADAVRATDFLCRQSVEPQCDPAEFCDGAGPSCPANVLLAPGTSCSDGDPCTADPPISSGTDKCSEDGTCASVPLCGNDVTDEACGEVCDGGDDAACPGACKANCTCFCGDGLLDPNEECDQGAGNSDLPNASCRTNCKQRRCSDGIIDDLFLELCDKGLGNADEPNALCRTDCQPQRCGDQIIDDAFGEQCEVDADCATPGAACLDCRCVDPLGTRVISVTAGRFLASPLPTLPFVTVMGTLSLSAGPPDGNGVAEITTAQGPFYFSIDIPPGPPGFQRVCQRITSCTGFIDCDGGTNVDVRTELNSLAAGLTCQPNTTNVPCQTGPSCCNNACEGVGIGSGNAATGSFGINPGDSGPGAVVLECQDATVFGSSGADCAQAAYGPDRTSFYTTGTSTAVVRNECPPAALGRASITVTGENFACAEWSHENSAGKLLLPAVAEEPTRLPGVFEGDVSAFAEIDD